MIPDHIRQSLVDVLGSSPQGIAGSKRVLTVERCSVVSYDALTHTAMVQPTGGGTPLRVRISTESQGVLPGTGTASSATPDHELYVLFGQQGGLYNDGVVLGSVYAPVNQAAPAYAPFQQAGSGTVVVHSGANGSFGDAEHVNWETGARSTTQMGAHNLDLRNNKDTVIGGSNMPRAEEQIRLASELMASAADNLSTRG